MKTAIYLLAATLLFGLILGCDAAPPPKEPATKTITLYSDGASPEEKKLWDRAKEQFEAAHPGVAVHYVYYTGNGKPFSNADYKKGIDDLIQKGEAPDIVSGNPAFFTALANEGYFTDLHALAKQKGDALDPYFEKPLLDSFASGTKQLAVPRAVTPMVVLYNKAVFREAGLPEPSGDWAWEDLADAAKKLRDRNGGAKVATVFPVQLMQMSTLALGNEGRLLAPDGTSFDGYLNGKPTVAAIAWYAGHVRDGLFDTVQAPDTMNRLQSGEVGMIVTHYSQAFSIPLEQKDKVGMIPAPSFRNKPRAVLGAFGGMAILQKSKHPDLAWDFLKFVTMDDNEISESFLRSFGYGVSKKVTPIRENDPDYRVLLDSIPMLRADLHQVNADVLNVQSELQRRLETIVTNSPDFQSDLNDLARFMDDALKKSVQR